jgi:hypothetical protein
VEIRLQKISRITQKNIFITRHETFIEIIIVNERLRPVVPRPVWLSPRTEVAQLLG